MPAFNPWNILLVPIIMACALGGTVVMIKLITRFTGRKDYHDNEKH